MNVFLSRQSLRANYLQVLNGGKLQSIWMWKNFAFPIPCETFFFLSVAERMHLASFFFLNVFLPSPPQPSSPPPQAPHPHQVPIFPQRLWVLQEIPWHAQWRGALSLAQSNGTAHQPGRGGKRRISMKFNHMVKTWRGNSKEDSKRLPLEVWS